MSTISRTTPQFTLESLLAAPTPMMAVVFVCVVETGMPVSEESRRQAPSCPAPQHFMHGVPGCRDYPGTEPVRA